MKNKLLALLFTTALCSPAWAQHVEPSSSGSSGTGSGVTSLSGGCPAFSPVSGAVVLSPGITPIGLTGATTITSTQCGYWFYATPGTTSYTITLPPLSGTTPTPVAAPWFVTIGNNNLVGGPNITVITPDGVNINAGGLNANSTTLVPGESLAFQINQLNNGWIGTGTAPAVTAPIFGPGYTVGSWYSEFGAGVDTTSLAPVAGTIYCYAGLLFNINTNGGGTGTLDQISARVVTAGISNMQYAIYSNDTTVAPYRPGALLAYTASVADTSVGVGSFSLNANLSVSSNTLYWYCSQFNDTTVRYVAKYGAPSSDMFASVLIGSTSNGGPVAGGNNLGGVSTPATYGAWPASLHGSTWSEMYASAALMGIHFSSIP